MVVCRVDPETERPDQRVFDFDPRDEIREARGEFVAAALTALRAFHVAGRPSTLRPFGSFPDYDLIRGVLTWLGEEDPAETREAVVDADPIKETLSGVMQAWDAAFGSDAAYLVDIDRAAGRRCAALRERIVEAVDTRGEWNSRRIGRWLTRHQSRVVAGRRFVREPGRDSRWRLERVRRSERRAS